MNRLENEAIKYAVGVYEGSQEGVYENSSRIDFIAGANSKWVQAEKVKAQIEILNSLSHQTVEVFTILTDLEKKLKQLENENT